MNHVDLALFQFDYDLTWMAFFMGADDHIYGRYGSRDAESDEGRISVAGLKNTMRRVLALHEASAKDRSPTGHVAIQPHELFPVNNKQCLHCHQVWEGMRARQRSNGTFDSASLQVYPLPENVGLVLDVEIGNRVKFVVPMSSASAAGLHVGDELFRLGDVFVISQADVGWALHNAPAAGTIRIEFTRRGEHRSAELKLRQGWRETDSSWRKSMYQEKE